MIKYGMKFNNEKYNILPTNKKEEMIIETIQDFLKTEYDTLYEDLSEKRKIGKDLFIEELKMRQLLAKQKICFATMNYKDLEKYMILLNKLKESTK